MRLTVPLLAAGLLAVALWTCDGGRDRAEFTCVQGSDVFTLDPQRMSWQHDILVGRSIYETLVANDADRGGLVPAADPVRSFGARLAACLAADGWPAGRSLVLLVDTNCGQALGQCATRWGQLRVPLVVVDEIDLPAARWATLGAARDGVVPVSFHGLEA